MKNVTFIALVILMVTMMSLLNQPTYGDVKSLSDSLLFDRNNDGRQEMELNKTGLGIGVTPSTNLEVAGNVIIENQINIGGDVGESSLNLNGVMGIEPANVSSNTVLAEHSLVLVDSKNANGNLRIVLPTSASVNGRVYDIKATSSSHGIFVMPQEGDLIDHKSFIGFSENQNNLPSLKVISNGDQWYVLGQTGDDDYTVIPTSISNLQLWLDGDDAQTLYSSYPSTLAGNGDLIERWLDKSGQGNDAIQTATTQQPTRVLSSSNDSYRSTVYFNTGIGMLTSCDISSAPYTIFTVYNRKTGISSSSRAIQGQVTNWLIGPYQNTHRHFASGWVSQNGDTVFVNENVVATAKNDGSNSTYYTNAIDKTESSSPVAGPGVIAMGNAGRYDEPLLGDLSEVIAYNRVLSDDEITSINEYLRQKWIEYSDGYDPELVCWLDASDNTTVYTSYPGTLAVNTSSVDYWEDKSGHGHHASWAANVTYQSNVLNNNNVVRVGGASGDGMVIQGEFNLSNFTVFIVFNTRNATVRSRRALNGVDENWLIGPYSGSVRYYANNNWVSQGNVSVVANTFYMGVAASNNSSNEFYIDGNDETDDTSANSGFTNLALGAKGMFPDEVLDGDIAEVRVYNYKMSDAERQAVEAELTTKWGL